VVDFSTLGDHLHLIVEADDNRALSEGMQGLSVRLAKRLNKLMARHGRVFADRFHAHVLRTPAEVRNALAYVLLNHRSHRARSGERVGPGALDRFSSAASFDGWCEPIAQPRFRQAGNVPRPPSSLPRAPRPNDNAAHPAEPRGRVCPVRTVSRIREPPRDGRRPRSALSAEGSAPTAGP
jgi:hypothetical protein